MSVRGRKPIEDHLRKDNVVRFRLTGTMKAQLATLAQEKSLNVSEYLTKVVEARLRAQAKKLGA